jgi:hypothetical protein
MKLSQYTFVDFFIRMKSPDNFAYVCWFQGTEGVGTLCFWNMGTGTGFILTTVQQFAVLNSACC